MNTLIEKIKGLPEPAWLSIYRGGDSSKGLDIEIADLKALVTQFEARGQALAKLLAWIDGDLAPGKMAEAITAARAALKAEGQSSPWVAVSERLPDSTREVWTTSIYREEGHGDPGPHVFKLWYDGSLWWQGRGNYPNKFEYPWEVLAWQEVYPPTPAPFTPPSDTGQADETVEKTCVRCHTTEATTDLTDNDFYCAHCHHQIEMGCA